MKKRNQVGCAVAIACLIGFVVWTVLVRYLDVRPIGPDGTSVGFATLNGAFHALTGVNPTLYAITDWLGLVPVAVALGFALLGLIQWIRRKSLLRVDPSLFVLGGFYLMVIAVYVLFEVVVINYRPVWIEGVPEASYPSSTTMLVMCVMPSAAMQLKTRIKNTALRRCAIFVIVAFTASMGIGRLLSGVHWLTDIIGGVLISAGLVLTYYQISRFWES